MSPPEAKDGHCQNDCARGTSVEIPTPSHMLAQDSNQPQTIRDVTTRPALCSYYFSTCTKGDRCPYAHSDEEKQLCIKSKKYPKSEIRPVPCDGDRALPFELCVHNQDDCVLGKECEHPHSQNELDEWERLRKAVEHTRLRIRPVREKSKLSMCSFLPNCPNESQCESAHNEAELSMWIKTKGINILSTY